MTQFHVDSDALSARSAAVRGSIERIRAEVDTMQHGLQELQSTWTGQASASFQSLVVDWRSTQARVEASLESINSALGNAALQYAQAEEANMRLFAG